jgi:hypothetical protein
MKFFAKIIKSVRSLYLSRHSELPHYFFSNKRVIIIGPADTAMSYLDSESIDNFDIIIRMNKALSNFDLFKGSLGSRTDLLFHCLDEHSKFGGGAINDEDLKKQKIKYLIYPHAALNIESNYLHIKKKVLSASFVRINPLTCKKLKKELGVKLPTTGIQVLNYIIAQDYLELHITGFTFLKTNYISGYRDHDKDDSRSTLEISKDSGNHDPDREFRYFKDSLLPRYSQKNIKMDDYLSSLTL